MTEFLVEIFGVSLAALFASMLPFIELKGGILLARGAGLSFLPALLVAFVGSSSVFFLLYFLLKPFLALLKKINCFSRFSVAIENYISDSANRIIDKKPKGLIAKRGGTVCLNTTIVLLFVAIPLPMTGVYTGTAIAVFLGLGFFRSLFAIGIGNLIAGIIISILAEILLPYVNIILYALLLVALFLLVVFIITLLKKARR